MPASIMVLATCCAAVAGTARTAILVFSRRMVSASSAIGWTRRPFIVWPILSGSLSNIHEMWKPRWVKPL